MSPENFRTARSTTDRPHLAGRLLLTTDGTVTPMLEQIVGEPIETAGLVHHEPTAEVDTLPLRPGGDDSGLVHRTTRLVGAHSGIVYVDAASVVALDALTPALSHDLITTTMPIGVLLRRHRIESFREILWWETTDGPAGVEGSRRYLIFMGGRPAMSVSERFAADCFRNL